MKQSEKKTVGIIGGMGPLATCDLMEKIIRLTKARTDQENLHLVVDCNTDIPDRTAAILEHGASPVPQLVRSGIKLQGMGADVLVMSCNTAHYFYDSIIPYFDIPLLHMIRETAKHLKAQEIQKAGLLATSGTLNCGVYREAMKREDIELLTPDGEDQEAVMGMIYQGVKAGRTDLDTRRFERAMEKLLERGAEVLILGCTELPVAVSRYGWDYPVADPTQILAESVVHYCVEIAEIL